MLVFGALKARAPLSLCSLYSSCTGLIPITRSNVVPRRRFSIMTNSHHDLFDYTSGRWAFNEALRHAERKLVFDVEGLCRLAAQSVGRSFADVVGLSKLAEGGFNRTFLITLRDDFQMIARLPYPATIPKYYAVASEAATLEFLRSSGLPVPQVYGYSPVSENAAKIEYIFMEFIKSTNLTDVWLELGELDIISILRQLVQLESKMMSISFPAGGSLYYAHDLEKKMAAIPLEDKRFCVGPDTRLPMWFGRRSHLEVDRGPYKSAEAAFTAGARKELTYLEQFGQPLLPFRRMRRDAYQFQEQSPSAHIENLKRFLLIASSIVPRDPALGHRFCIRHPDIQQSNIMVQRSSDSDSDSGWQHASILPPFLLAGVPQRLQNHHDPVSQSMALPSLPDDFNELDETEQAQVKELYRRRLVHYRYIQNTEQHNKLHYDAMTDFMYVLRSRLFTHASDPWEGETLELKVALIKATERWKMLTAGNTPCPITFDAEDVHETMKLNAVQEKADRDFEILQSFFDLGPEGWVPTQYYEQAVGRCKKLKEKLLKEAESEEDRVEILTHWPWDDMDEEKYN